jgi:uncharacterized protein DUF6627
MLRERFLQPRWLVYPVVLWGVTLVSLPQVAAAPLPPARDGGATTDLETVRVVLESRIVRERLLALGVSPADAAATLDRLTPAERAELAARAREMDAGGDAIAILAIAIILGLLVILVLELMGRRVISRP